MVKILKLTEEKFGRAWLNPLNDSSAGCIKSDGGKSKTRVKLQSYYFVGALNIVLSYKNVLHDKNRTFSTRVFSFRFSEVGFVDL